MIGALIPQNRFHITCISSEEYVTTNDSGLAARSKTVVMAHHDTLEVMSCARMPSAMDSVPHQMI